MLSGLANLDDSGLTMLSSLAKGKKAAEPAGGKVRICILELERQEDYLPSLSASLKNYHPSFEVSTAANYSDTLDILSSEQGVKLVVIDLRLPGVDGIKLLARLFADFSGVPAIVLLSKIEAPWQAKFSGFCGIGLLSHPLGLNDLRDAIEESLRNKNDRVDQTNNLVTLLALLEKEQKSTLMALSSGSRSGSCFVRNGQIVDAVCGDKGGEGALRELLTWDRPEVLFTDFADSKIKRKIGKSIFELVAEPLADREVKDFSQSGEAQEFSATGSNKGKALPRDSNILRDNGPQAGRGAVLHDVGFSVDPKKLKEESIMALESYLERFKKINGYKASAIMNFTGEILAQDSNDPNIDLGMVGATFNDIFRTAHEASDKIGLEACREAAISTPKGIIIMRCSGTKSKVHYHIITIFSAEGNQALAKMEMEKMIQPVMEELA